MENIENEFAPRIDLSALTAKYAEINDTISKKLIGQPRLIELIMTAILADGHVLIEGVPGVAKTFAAKLMAKALDLDFSRIQFTPDLMPSDVIGTNIFNPKNIEFEYKKGPIFANIILIDEINRAPAKTQAALFESMEERQVTIDGNAYALDVPYIVLATQNPVEHEGTYKLPEAQLDRFLFKIEVDYPTLENEVRILEEVSNLNISNDLSDIKPVISKAEIAEFKATIRQVKAEPDLLNYIARLVENTRQNPDLFLGASPRASIGILNSSKALAALRGRDFITPDDIREVTIPVLNHRVVLSPEREMDGTKTKQIIQEIIDRVEVPR
ncbi:MAG: MoxR family ATPase [Bacteroidota bacterium]